MKKFDWKNIKKSDWLVLGLVGVLLLVIALPTGNEEGSAEKAGSSPNANVSIQNTYDSTADNTISGSIQDAQEIYVNQLEEKLEEILAAVEGVGEVKVMITVSDTGEQIVEKDSSGRNTSTAETDSGSAGRNQTEQELVEETIYVKTEEGTYPYVQNRKVPTIEGVVVAAEGGGNPTVISDISDTVKALFQVEAHRIKVVKMCSREESK